MNEQLRDSGNSDPNMMESGDPIVDKHIVSIDRMIVDKIARLTADFSGTYEENCRARLDKDQDHQDMLNGRMSWGDYQGHQANRVFISGIKKRGWEGEVDRLTRQERIEYLRFVIGLPIANFDAALVLKLADLTSRNKYHHGEKLVDYLYQSLTGKNLENEVDTLVDWVYEDIAGREDDLTYDVGDPATPRFLLDMEEEFFRMQARQVLLKALFEGQPIPRSFQYVRSKAV